MSCPYLVEISRQKSTICCENILPGQTITSHFGCGADLKQAVRTYCKGDPGACPWHRILSGDYLKKEKPGRPTEDVFRY